MMGSNGVRLESYAMISLRLRFEAHIKRISIFSTAEEPHLERHLVVHFVII